MAMSEAGKVANEVETDADDDVSSTSTSTVTGAGAVRELATSHQVVSQQVEDTLVQDVDVIQEQLLYLRKGEIAKYLLDVGRLLQVRVPGLHLSLESNARFAGNTDTDEMVTAQMPRALRGSLQIEVEGLSFMPCTEVGLAQIVDSEGEWVEKSTPEGVLFSAEGLLLKLKSTILRFRARLN